MDMSKYYVKRQRFGEISHHDHAISYPHIRSNFLQPIDTQLDVIVIRAASESRQPRSDTAPNNST
jgi:hypothetical protein